MGQVLALLGVLIFCYWITAAFWVELALEKRYTDGYIITPHTLYEHTHLNKAGSIIIFILISLTDPLYLFVKIMINICTAICNLCRKLFLKKEED